eukprot:Blabericola_migrator_1__9167@NODE_4901_length_940_cov_3_981672_g3071_i0_p1_GENE_NODE_4901_length_940_cov_3_981672_g3071_i0NODE_4901_length_940_cov_3_981672_g3071_i0_p1_ORF_typecomplete_len122_score13_18Flavi_capsid/PF01003_19/0_028Colicin_im/PF03857_13/0_065_NODE_4901_length_940_cov_3_981672_g3071_i0574939
MSRRRKVLPTHHSSLHDSMEECQDTLSSHVIHLWKALGKLSFVMTVFSNVRQLLSLLRILQTRRLKEKRHFYRMPGVLKDVMYTACLQVAIGSVTLYNHKFTSESQVCRFLSSRWRRISLS